MFPVAVLAIRLVGLFIYSTKFDLKIFRKEIHVMAFLDKQL